MSYLQSMARFDFLDIPLLRDINLRTFTYLELIMYPGMLLKFKNSARLSMGYGFVIPVNDMISVKLYFNACSWGSQAGADRERRGYINLNFGFF
jgi:hypothetical protein